MFRPIVRGKGDRLTLLDLFDSADGPVQFVNYLGNVNPSPLMEIKQDELCKKIENSDSYGQNDFPGEEVATDKCREGAEHSVGNRFEQGDASRFGERVHEKCFCDWVPIRGENNRPIKSFLKMRVIYLRKALNISTFGANHAEER